MAKQKKEIEEAVVVEESAAVMVLDKDFDKPTLPAILDKDTSLALIQKAFDKYATIEIDGTKDKANYELVVAGIKELKDSRLAWDKSVEQNLTGPAKAWYNSLTEDVKAIIADFKSKEEILRAKKVAIDNAKKDEKEAAEKLKLIQMNKRIEVVIGLGGKSAGDKYVFDYDLTLFITLASLKDFDDKKWDKAIKEIQEAYTAEQDRLVKEKELADKLIEDNRILADANKAKQRKLRVKELTMEGFLPETSEGKAYQHPAVLTTITQSMIDDYSDEDWDNIFNVLHDEIDQLGQTEEIPETVEETIVEQSSEAYEEPLAFEKTTIATQHAVNYIPAVATEEEMSFEPSEELTEELFECNITFSKNSKPYIDLPFSAKSVIRIYPIEFTEEAIPEGTVVKLTPGNIEGSLQYTVIGI